MAGIGAILPEGHVHRMAKVLSIWLGSSENIDYDAPSRLAYRRLSTRRVACIGVNSWPPLDLVALSCGISSTFGCLDD